MKSQLLILSFLLLSIFGKTQNIRVTQFTDSIKIDDIKPHLETLASDRYEGRESGEQGQKMAAKYISNHFQSIGLEPYNQTASSYIQSFSFKNSSTSFTGFQTFIQPFNRTVIRTSNYYYKEDFEVENQSVELVWLGTGFDYSEVDVKGKIVVVWLATPADSILKKYRLEDSKSDEMKSFNLRSQLAKVNGAKGIFMIHPTEEAFDLYESRNQMMSKMNPQIKKNGNELNGFPTVYFKPKVARFLLKLSKKKFNLLLEKKSLKTSEVQVSFNRGYYPDMTENVIGILPGTTKKDEYVFVTAHYDHLGVQDGRVYNGADDNGSGTSALLALAETFAKAKKAGLKLERNIVFVAFSGEELGLLGSKFLTNNLSIPHESIYAVYNIDMIGRAGKNKAKQIELYIVGEKKCTDENAKITKNHFSNIYLDDEYNSKNHPERLYYRSDHYNFARFGVDFIFFTTGLHENYHLPSDDSDKIDYESLTVITRLIFRNICSGANT